MKLYSHTTAALIGLTAAVILALGTETISRWFRNAEPIENWVDLRSVFVPDHVIGQEANVVYDWDVKREFMADWSVEAVPAQGEDGTCRVSWHEGYAPETVSSPSGMTMKFLFRTSPCKWEPGEYVLKTEGVIHREGYNDKTIKRTSNVFRVLPEGSQLYVAPEQVQKLEEMPQ